MGEALQATKASTVENIRTEKETLMMKLRMLKVQNEAETPTCAQRPGMG